MSSQKTILPLGSAAQADNDPHRLDFIRQDQHDWPISSRMSADEIKAVLLAVGTIGPGLLFLLWIVKGITCWGQSYDPSMGCTYISTLFYFYILALVIGAIATPVILLWGRMARTRAEVIRATLTRDRYSNPVSAITIHQQGQRAAAGYFLAAQKAEIAMAPYKALPAGLDAYSVSNSSAAPAQIAATLDVGGGPDIGPLMIEDWLMRLDEQPHAIFAAKTKGGKSTMAKVGLKARIDNKESVFVIDPHSNGWLDLPGVGGGLNWDDIENAMATVVRLYHERMQERERFIQENGRELPQDFFPRVTVIFDEANESRTNIEARHKRSASPWQPFVEIMGSGARKVGISLWLICQSALIKNLGGSTVMRRNFTVFALDHETIRELVEDEEPLPTRRQAIIERIGGSSYPAATVLNGQAFLLDRTGLDRLTPASAAGCAWQGWNYNLRPRMPARPVVSASVQSQHVTSASVSVPVNGDQTDVKMPPHRKRQLIAALRRAGLTRSEARDELRAMGEGLDNDDWADAVQ